MKDKIVTKSQIDQEHLEIEQLTASLLRALAERHVTGQRIVELLGMLRERVEAHFSDETPGGYIHGQVRKDSELAAECDDLRRDHKYLTDKLTSIIALAGEGSLQPPWWDELERQFHALSIEIANHEFRERKLLDKVEDES